MSFMDKGKFLSTLCEALQQQEPSTIDLSKSFVDNGGYSLAAVRWIDLIYPATGVVLNFFDVMGDQPLEALLGAATPAAPADGSGSAVEAEEGVL
ncbi:hypothetical protein BE20_36925 [Sorangium cellulosum]|uniref:Carrier domain-containing protein n=1 Tax=Sorangium cellulosum TaxID=56 RepID=A0A150SFD5_SORCE|nr:hypothetical protein BE18_04625 [Sorangium cellulosum]KYF97894.1 hypothetical protein BE20_36925 [Sorangium cellulosum]